jgi:hypothetical protein
MLRLVVVDGSKNGGGVKRETKPRERQLLFKTSAKTSKIILKSKF